MNAKSSLLTILLLTVCFNLYAALFIRAENGQWFYFEESISIDFFYFKTTENSGNMFKYAPPAPIQAIDTITPFIVKIREIEIGVYELWAERTDTSLQIIQLTERGVEYFKANEGIKIYKARAKKFFLKELPDNIYELWSLEKNEKMFNISERAANVYKKRPELLDEVMVITN